MYAISTAWNAWRALSGDDIVSEVTQLGFVNVELSFSLPVHLFTDIKDSVKAGRIRVVSLHNFCPLPVISPRGDTTPDMFLVSSPDEGERERAVRFTKQTIDAAHDIGAQCVVLHLGRVDHQDDGKVLSRLLEEGKSGSLRYRFLKARCTARRERCKKKYLDQVLKSLDELNGYAMQRGVLIGVETRYYIREIPSFREVGIILDTFKKGNIHYWHDIGHAQFKENLGVDVHEAYFKAYGDRMIGMHIHDIVRSDDHRAPLCGTLNYRKFKQYVRPDMVKVFEMHHPATADEVRRGYEFFRESICPE
ncbi:MAG TPA: TIM barrel protein [bacterium]|nr:TIM barrel protein [bacterium]